VASSIAAHRAEVEEHHARKEAVLVRRGPSGAAVAGQPDAAQEPHTAWT
jgi:hypothetical protein